MNSLEQLKDISLPTAVHNYPIAPGWWALLFIILAVLVFLIIQYKKRQAQYKCQKLALAQLAENNLDNEAIVGLLKWAALSYFPRRKVASLFGESFQQFLIANLPEAKQATFKELSHTGFQGLYHSPTSMMKNVDTEQFGQAAKLWLQHAIAIKTPRKKGVVND
ncbi:DUF4381 domain-containing protein [Thalassotalea sp. PLHSN55]|uniref:DUF4381 domain-containing protein n=1 Tax=Thalassotalea sp. PLHSN55 TaxID=3435888 RepID=UPI003F853339